MEKELFYREVTKGLWLKAKRITLPKEFIEFLVDERRQIDDVVSKAEMKRALNDSDSGSWDNEDNEEEEKWVITSKEELFPELNS